jgi:hypothetical protein
VPLNLCDRNFVTLQIFKNAIFMVIFFGMVSDNIVTCLICVCVINIGQQILAQFTSQAKILCNTHFLHKEKCSYRPL